MAYEHMFAPGGPAPGPAALAVAAAELAELLLEEVSAARKDWPAVERLARELAGLAARAQEPVGAGAQGRPAT